MIDDGDIVVDGHNKNFDHKASKDPFLAYEKGESSKPKPNNKLNYPYSNDDNVINMVEPMDFEYCDIITIKGKQEKTKPKTLFFLRDPTTNTTDNTSSQHCANAIMFSHTKWVLKDPSPSTPDLEQHKEKTLVGASSRGAKLTKNSVATSYSVLDQLK